jgi:hypothetical protein
MVLYVCVWLSPFVAVIVKTRQAPFQVLVLNDDGTMAAKKWPAVVKGE